MGRHLRVVLSAAAVLFIGAAVICSVLVYKISYPGSAPEAVNPSHYLLPSLDVEISTSDGEGIPGWWIPGREAAPGIILASGYGMNRSDSLSLATALHESGFNILAYSQRGSYASPERASTLGLNEAEDMQSAVELLQLHSEINRAQLGIWGVDVGARAALKAAAAFPEIRAIAADSAFDSVADFLNYKIADDFGLKNRIVQFGCCQIFRLTHLFSGISINEKLQPEDLSDRAILFIKGENRRELGSLTNAIYDEIQPQKEMISLNTARVHLMSEEDLGSYDRNVTNFFLLNLQ